ncbi:MAG: hypothetical protein CL625_01245 [Arenimonas sp.]|nr:hypothetical protein [Arenimonas sp.]
MARRRTWLLLFALMAVASLVVFAYRFAVGTDAPAGAAGPRAAASTAPDSPVSGAVPSTDRPVQPLPSLDLPLAEVLPELERRAALGEAGAACRLATELASCQWLPMRREQHLNWLVERQRVLENTAASGDAKALASFTRRFEQQSESRERGLAAQEARCAGVTPPDEPTMARRWYHAARLGSRVAQRYWATGRSFPPTAMLNSQAELAVYRAQAPDMAWRLVREGDLPTTLAMAGALAPLDSRRFSLLGQAVQEDPVESLALYLRLQETLAESNPQALDLLQEVGHRIELLGELTTPAQRADAERRKREMAQWQAPRWENNFRHMNLRAMQIPVPPVACHAEAGEQPMPEFSQVRIGDGPL